MEIGKNDLIEIKNEAVKMVEDTQTRYRLASDVLKAFNEHCLARESKNNVFHLTASKFENAAKVLLDDSASHEKILGVIEKNLEKIPLPANINYAHETKIRREVAELGLQTLMVEIKAFNLNQETTALKKSNAIDASHLAKEILSQVEELKRQVQINRQNHDDVVNALNKNNISGLSEAAHLINPDGKDYDKNKDQEIDDFLNGGDLIL